MVERQHCRPQRAANQAGQDFIALRPRRIVCRDGDLGAGRMTADPGGLARRWGRVVKGGDIGRTEDGYDDEFSIRVGNRSRENPRVRPVSAGRSGRVRVRGRRWLRGRPSTRTLARRRPRAPLSRHAHRPECARRRGRRSGSRRDAALACRCRRSRSLSFATPSTASPEITVVFCHSGSVIVFETTYFGPLLILSAKGPSREGHAAGRSSTTRARSSRLRLDPRTRHRPRRTR